MASAGLAHVVVHVEVIFGGAVGAVQTSNVHTGFDELEKVVVILGGRTDGVYDLALRMNACLFLFFFGSSAIASLAAAQSTSADRLMTSLFPGVL